MAGTCSQYNEFIDDNCSDPDIKKRLSGGDYPFRLYEKQRASYTINIQ